MPQAQLSPTSDEYILDLLGTSEQKLLKLMDELGGKDVDDIMKEMEDAEVKWENWKNNSDWFLKLILKHEQFRLEWLRY